MDYFKQIFDYINHSGSPELYYIAIFIAFFAAVIIAEKIIKIAIVLGIVALVAFGPQIFNSPKIQDMISSLKVNFSNFSTSKPSLPAGVKSSLKNNGLNVTGNANNNANSSNSTRAGSKPENQSNSTAEKILSIISN